MPVPDYYKKPLYWQPAIHRLSNKFHIQRPYFESMRRWEPIPTFRCQAVLGIAFWFRNEYLKILSWVTYYTLLQSSWLLDGYSARSFSVLAASSMCFSLLQWLQSSWDWYAEEESRTSRRRLMFRFYWAREHRTQRGLHKTSGPPAASLQTFQVWWLIGDAGLGSNDFILQNHGMTHWKLQSRIGIVCRSLTFFRCKSISDIHGIY